MNILNWQLYLPLYWNTSWASLGTPPKTASVNLGYPLSIFWAFTSSLCWSYERMSSTGQKYRVSSVNDEQRGSKFKCLQKHLLPKPTILTHLQKFSPLNSSTLPFPLCSAPSTFWMLLGRPSFSMLRGPRTLWPVYTQNRVPVERKCSL